MKYVIPPLQNVIAHGGLNYLYAGKNNGASELQTKLYPIQLVYIGGIMRSVNTCKLVHFRYHTSFVPISRARYTQFEFVSDAIQTICILFVLY